MERFKAIMVFVICIAIWVGCIAAGGVLGVMFGWMPAMVYLFVLAMFD